AGVYPITLQGSSASGTATQTLDLTVGSAPVITSPASDGIVTGHFAAFNVTATGVPAPLVTVTTLPAGLVPTTSATGSSVLVAGTVTATADVTAKVTATNSAGTTSQTLAISSSATGGPVVTTPTTGLARFEVGTAGVTYQVHATPASTMSVHGGTLPPGLTFTAGATGTATISGTPTTAGYWSVALWATKNGSPPGVAFVELEVFGAPVFTSGTTATFVEGQSGSFTVTATGLPAVALAQVGGSLPPGLTFTTNGNDNTATISGTATQPGSFVVTLNAANLLDQDGVGQPLTIDVDQPPTVTSPSTCTFAAGRHGTCILTASGYPTPSLAETGTLPAGLTFTANGDGTAVIAGTPSTATAAATSAASTVTVTATSAGGTAVQELVVQVGPAATFTSTATANFAVGTTSAFVISTTGTGTGGATVTLSATGALPGGLTFATTGSGTAVISGT